jgi:hypothetical protein
MKSYPTRASSILSVLALLVASGLTGTAQQPAARRQPMEQKQERPIPALSTQELNPEALRIALPQECKGIEPVVQIHGNPQGSAVTLSSALASFLNSNNVSSKGYDDPRQDIHFADSFRLLKCRVCYATIEIQVKHPPGQYVQNAPNWSNDSMTVGVAPFTLRFVSGNIWTGANPNPKLLGPYALLPTSSLSQTVDITAQDDTEFDFAKLTVWYY